MRQPLPAGVRSALVAALFLTGTAYAQEPAKLHRVQDSFPAPIHAGTYHVATGQFQRATSFSGSNDGPSGAEAIYRNNYYTAVFLDINGSHLVVDEGRLPSTSSPTQSSPYPSVQGLADSYQVNNIQLAYATDSVGDGTAQLTFYEQYRPCINPVGTLTPILDLTIGGLPGTLTPGTTTPYTFDIDMSGFEFCVRADGDGQFDGDAFDFFGWGLEMSADPGSMIGPIIGARPGALAPTGEGTCFSNPSATVGSGLYSIDQAYEVELASGNGRCFNEGGYDEVDNDPSFVSFWLVLGANLGFSCVSCVEGIDDEYEDNDTCATAVSVPSNLTTGNLVVRKPGVDEDYYRVTVAPNSTLNATIFFNQFQADIDLWLIDSSCGALLDQSTGQTGTESVRFINTSSTPVDVIVNPFVYPQSPAECGDYSLVLTNGGIPNDTCSNAAPVTTGSTPFDTSPATDSGEAWACANGGAPDAWFSYTAVSAADLSIATCGSTYDTALQVFAGTCGDLIPVACNDDACGIQSQIDLTGLSAGVTLWIQVGGYAGSTGAGSLTVTELPPPGQPGNPSPADGATAVSVDQDLSWSPAAGATTYEVYLGTNSTPGPGDLQGALTGTTFALGQLSYSTVYYWRVDAINGNGTTTGPVWSFTTEDDPNPGNETVIFADSFDGSLSTQWSSNGGVRVRSGSAFAGSGGARIRRSQYLEVTVDASGFTGLRLECARRCRNLDSGETLRVIVNGTTLETLTGSSGWRTTDFDLSTLAGLNQVTVRFDLSANRRNETGDIDEVRIVGIN